MLCVFKAGHHNSPAILKREYGFSNSTKKTLPLAKREYPKGEGDENNAKMRQHKKTLPLTKREYPKGEGDENNAEFQSHVVWLKLGCTFFVFQL